jgi:hypothetical protein
MIGRFKVFLFSLRGFLRRHFRSFRFITSSSWSIHNGVDASWLVATHLEALHLEGLACGLKAEASFFMDQRKGEAAISEQMPSKWKSDGKATRHWDTLSSLFSYMRLWHTYRVTSGICRILPALCH